MYVQKQSFEVATHSCLQLLQAAPELRIGIFRLRGGNTITNSIISRPGSRVGHQKGSNEDNNNNKVNKSKEDARKTRDEEFVAKQDIIDEDPTKSCRRMSEELNTSVWTISTTNREVQVKTKVDRSNFDQSNQGKEGTHSVLGRCSVFCHGNCTKNNFFQGFSSYYT